MVTEATSPVSVELLQYVSASRTKDIKEENLSIFHSLWNPQVLICHFYSLGQNYEGDLSFQKYLLNYQPGTLLKATSTHP